MPIDNVLLQVRVSRRSMVRFLQGQVTYFIDLFRRKT